MKNYLPENLNELNKDDLINLVGTLHDRLSKALQLNSEYEQVTENVALAIIRFHIDGTVNYLNAFARALFGVESSDNYDKLFQDAIMPDYIPYTGSFTDLLGHLKNGTIQPERFVKRVKSCTGQSLWISWTLQLLRNEGKEITGLVALGTDISHLKQTEAVLHRNEYILRKSHEISRTGSWMWEISNDRLTASDLFFKIFGMEPETSFTRWKEKVKKLIFPEYHEYIDLKFSRSLQYQTTESFTYQIQLSNGEIKWVMEEISVMDSLDENGKVMVGTVRDITWQKKTENKLREYQLIVSSSGELMSLIAPDYRYINVNQAYLDFHRKTIHEVEGHTVAEMFGEETFEKFIKPNIDRCLLGETVSDQYWQELPDGTRRFLDVKYNPVREINGNISGVTVSSRDITDLKMVEEALQRSEQNFRSIFHNAAIGIEVLDEQGRFLQVNKAFTGMLGYTSEELIEMTIDEITFEEDRNLTRQLLSDLFSGKIDHYRTEKRYIRKDGSIFWADLSVNIFHDINTRQKRAIGTIIDITQSKLLREQLEKSHEEAIRANKAKSEFLANMSHEIRTPLNAVIGFTELLETLITDKKQMSYLKSIKSGGKSLLLLINDILDLSKIEAGKINFKYEPVNPFALIEEIKQIFSLKISEKQLEFIIEVDESIPPVLILDEVRVRQVIFNLMGNAIKFTEQGYVKLSMKKKEVAGDKSKIDLNISVEDTGIGIPEDQHQVIFDAFQQHSGHDTRKYGGTGLGLSISKRLVEMMGGTIYMHSKPGEGSVFGFILRNVPIGTVSDDQPEENTILTTEVAFSPATILVVDDVVSNREMMREILNSLHFTVAEAEDGQQAVEIARILKPDLIFMDLRMPVMDGFEATRQIKSCHDLQKTVVIALTALHLSEDKYHEKDDLFNGYLQKPVTRNNIINELMNWIPHQVKDISGEKTLSSDNVYAFFQNFQMDRRLCETFLKILDKDLYEKWYKAYNDQLSDDIRDFSLAVLETGRNFGITPLMTYAENLMEALENFEINALEKSLKHFPVIADQIKKCIG